MMIDTGGQFVSIMGHDNEGDSRISTIVFDDPGGQESPFVIQAMEGFVQDQQIW